MNHKTKQAAICLSLAVALVGCATGKNQNIINEDGKVVKHRTEKGLMIEKMSDNVNQCIALATKKYDDDQAKLGERDVYVSEGSITGDQLVALQLAKALENAFLATIQSNKEIELARLGVPFSSSGLPACEKLGYSHMVVEKKRINHNTLNNLGGKFIKGALQVFGIYQGAKVALHIADKLAEPTITSGDGSTNILGDGNNFQPDNRTNPCLDEGTCVTPPDEEIIDEPVDTPIDPPVDDPVDTPVDDPVVE